MEMDESLENSYTEATPSEETFNETFDLDRSPFFPIISEERDESELMDESGDIKESEDESKESEESKAAEEIQEESEPSILNEDEILFEVFKELILERNSG